MKFTAPVAIVALALSVSAESLELPTRSPSSLSNLPRAWLNAARGFGGPDQTWAEPTNNGKREVAHGFGGVDQTWAEPTNGNGKRGGIQDTWAEPTNGNGKRGVEDTWAEPCCADKE